MYFALDLSPNVINRFFFRFSYLSFIIRQNTQMNWRRDKFVGVQCNMSFMYFHVRPVTVDILKPIRLSKISSPRSYVSQPSLDLQDIRFLNHRLLQQSPIESTYEIIECHDVCFDKWLILISSYRDEITVILKKIRDVSSTLSQRRERSWLIKIYSLQSQ